jgi:glycosyltransferase involved in cell wall biosynthesis
MIIFSDSESQSCVVLEALCCGKPCIVTNTGGVKELIVDGINGFKVSIRDSNDLTNKMNKMIGDYDTFNQVQISENASAIYSYEVVGKQFSDCYKTVGK